MRIFVAQFSGLPGDCELNVNNFVVGFIVNFAVDYVIDCLDIASLPTSD